MTKQDIKKKCDACKMRTWNPPEKIGTPFGTIKIIPGFYTCGPFLRPVKEGKMKERSCGCIISLKTILNKLTSCPQGKW